MTAAEAQFLKSLSAQAEHANRPGGPGADHASLCVSPAPEYGLSTERAGEILAENITEIMGAG